LELHLRCLYTHDARGRMLRTREPGGRPAPRFHLGRTRLGNLWRLRADLPAAEVRALARLAAREAPLGDASASSGVAPPPPERLEPFRRALSERAPVTVEWAGPAYAFPEAEVADRGGSGGASRDAPPVVAVTRENAALLEQHFAAEIEEVALRQPSFAVVIGGAAVALCCAARPMHSPSGRFESCIAAEASVATALRHRGLGYAPRVVSAWAAAVVARGGVPLYSTSWQNRASRAVARKLGLVCYAEDLHLT
jgi:hypothetical protein